MRLRSVAVLIGNIIIISTLVSSGDQVCFENEIIFDHCNQACKCSEGEWDCCRVRAEFTRMPLEERRRYITTLKAVGTHPKLKHEYADIVSKHNTFFAKKIHEVREFLPWHRWYILQYENLLQKIDCRVTQPYWDSSEHTGDPWNNNYFELWNSGDHGLGSDGSPTEKNCVIDGPFAKDKWNVTETGGGGCLRRKFVWDHPYIPPPNYIEEVIHFPANPWKKFAEEIRIQIHNPLHEKIGGHMNSPAAPNEPVFWFHHTFIDKLWNDWQNNSPKHKFNDYFLKNATNDKNMVNITVRPSEMLDILNQPGGVSVCYL